MLQPSPKGDKDEEHRRRVEEGDWALGRALRHGDDQHHTRVHVGDGRGEHNQDVHVGRVVAQRAVRLDVEVAASEDLWQKIHSDFGR